jgi:hypothetical protein
LSNGRESNPGLCSEHVPFSELGLAGNQQQNAIDVHCWPISTVTERAEGEARARYGQFA